MTIEGIKSENIKNIHFSEKEVYGSLETLQILAIIFGI